MDLSSGNSGSKLEEVILKTGEGCTIEGAFCRHLGEIVCPKIYDINPQGYVMEKLEQIPRTPDLLRDIENLLERFVWIRPSQYFEVTGQENYIEFQKSMGIETPNFARPTEFCLIHGDPTVSNAMNRISGDRVLGINNSLVLIDPRAPNGHVPSAAMVDRGKILQSYFGWEEVAYGEESHSYWQPHFMSDPELKRQALFWLGYHAARIEQLEISRNLNRRNILDWCKQVRKHCHV
jgi:hypothetical protein